MREEKASVEEMVTAIDTAKENVCAAREYILDAQSEIAEMRKVLGSKCPTCWHYLLEHDIGRDPATWDRRLVLRASARICIPDLASHPAIAAELGLTPAQKEPSNA